MSGASGAAPADLTGGKILLRNSALNLAGWILPIGVALVSVPLLVRGLGTERFGVLTLGWVVIGYFGLFDFGLGRALTKLVAERIGTAREGEIPELVWTSLLLMLIPGVVGALLLGVGAPWLVDGVLRVTPALEAETERTFRLLALSLPWVISTAGLLGALEAGQRFGLVNAVRVPSILFNYLAPLALLPFTSSLVPIVAVLVVGRIVSWGAYLFACLRAFPALRTRISVSWNQVPTLARFGGWMTVSNIVSPLMTQLDRFLVGALISMTAVAYYASPYELVTRLLLVPAAVMGVFFPAFAATIASDRARTGLLFGRAVRIIFVVVFPLALLLVVWAPEGLRLWLGPEFELRSTMVMRWLALGVFINSLAQVPFALIQGLGRPDITGRLHLAELPLYAMAIWALSRVYGLEGVAIAWVLRIALDTVVLFAIANRFFPARATLIRALLSIGFAATLLGLATLDGPPALKLLFCAGAIPSFAWFAWARILDPAERSFVHTRLSTRLPQRGGSSSTPA